MLSAVFCWATPTQKLYNKRDFKHEYNRRYGARAKCVHTLCRAVRRKSPCKGINAEITLLDNFLWYIVLDRIQHPISIAGVGLHRDCRIARLAQIVGLSPPAI